MVSNITRTALLAGIAAVLATSALAGPAAAQTVREGNYYYTTCYVADTFLCTEYRCYWNGEDPSRNFCRVSDQCVVRDGDRCSDILLKDMAIDTVV